MLDVELHGLKGLAMYDHPSTRRQFVGASALSLAVGSLLAPAVHAAGTDVLKIGLIGCGGRGTGAASQALRADPHVKLTALADVFEDRLDLSLRSLAKLDDVSAKVDVPAERRFTGFDACERLLATDVDVVLLCTPPHFRPLHLKAAIEAGKHVFAEKPCAVDAPGVRSVLDSCRVAKEKNLSVVSGLCLRYSRAFRETVARIHDGAIGRPVAMLANDYRGPIWVKPRQPDWTDMHWQMRNWYYFTWLSGDFNVEQHVHYLDVCAWVAGDRYPASAVGMGGRQVRTGPEYGQIFDHHGVTYEYADGLRIVSNTRQIPGCANDMCAIVLGSKGQAVLSDAKRGCAITAEGQNWKWKGSERDDFYQTEHDELFAAIRAGRPINNGQYMAHSTLLAIQGRMATYTGQQVAWTEALESKDDLSPAKYAWGDAPAVEVPVPGVTKLR